VCEKFTPFWNDYLKTRQEMMRVSLETDEHNIFGIGSLMTGRQLIWHVLQFYNGSEMYEGEMFTMQDLEGIPWHGIKNASSFLQGWQFIDDGMSEQEQSSTHRLRGILWNKIKNEPLFQHSLWMYDMMDPQDARKTCKYLLDIISHIVDRRGREHVDKLRKWEVEQVKIAVAEGYNLDNFIGSDSYEAMKQMMMDADEDFDNLPRYNAMPAVARAAKPQTDDEKKGRTETQ